MNLPRYFCMLAIVFFRLMPAFSQEGKVIVEYPASKEVKRTAHRLRISVERLKNAREALRDATALAIKLDPDSSIQPGTLSGLWIQLQRSKAIANIESVYDSLRAAARKASDPQSYEQCASAAQGLISPLLEIDAEKAAELAKQWPNPPSALGEAARKARDNTMGQIQQQWVQRLAYRDPERAIDMITGKQSGKPASYSLRGYLARHLINTGQQAKALDLMDLTLRDFKRNPDLGSIQDFASFTQQLATVSPERFLQAFDLLARAAVDASKGAQDFVPVNIGGENLMLAPAEVSVMNVFRGMYNRPELAIKALGMLPALKMKIDRAGGLDSFLNPGTGTRLPAAAISAPAMAADSGSGPSGSGGDLFERLRGKYDKDPAMVRATLAETARDPDRLDALFSCAQKAVNDDPDLSSAALDVALPVILQVKPLFRRSSLMQQLIRLYRRCDGEVDAKVLREGFIIADQLRQEEKERNPEKVQRTGTNSMADHLESMLVSELALDDFPTAMRFVRSMPDDVVKYAAMLQIIQSLSGNY